MCVCFFLSFSFVYSVFRPEDDVIVEDAEEGKGMKWDAKIMPMNREAKMKGVRKP